MKYCDKCKKSFPNNQVFCTECGNKLNDSVVNPNRTSNNSINVWLPVILAAIGVLIGLFLNGFLGSVLVWGGVIFAVSQKKKGEYQQLPFVLTWVLAIIDIITWIVL